MSGAEFFVAVGGNVVSHLVYYVGNLLSNPIADFCKCKDNAENLKEVVEEMKHLTKLAKDFIAEVGNRGEMIEKAAIPYWLTKAERLINEAENLVRDVEENENRSFLGLSFNPISRYKLSIKAKKDTESITQHKTQWGRFNFPLFHAPV